MFRRYSFDPHPPFQDRPRSEQPYSPSELFQVVCAASTAIRQAGYGCYLFGSAAVYFTCPNHRRPGDIDLVVFPLAGQPIYDAEKVKMEIQIRDPRFYRVTARTPGAPYTQFWFSFSNDPQHPNFTHSIKVDIVPADGEGFKVPRIPMKALIVKPDHRSREIPIMSSEGTFSIVPPFALLLMKLRGWYYNRTSAKENNE
ncbi:hypothetical protein PQX77_022145 [Marasmius sp. AFHP31]|nr:hypothetical protein PQX77_022145 [Marasmius sp. AFHP31]